MRRALLCVLALSLFPGAAPARASSTMESMFQDDDTLIYTTPEARTERVKELAKLGVDRIRMTIVWRAIAPSPEALQQPSGFDDADPASYPAAVWNNYDDLVEKATAAGIAVNFNVTSPVPRWASKPAPRADIQDNYEPNPHMFHDFVLALGRRYSGTYPDGRGGTLPRVDFWEIWNEPNLSGWLTPTWQRGGNGRWYERSAPLYRSLLQAAWTALRRTGHGDDTILFGDTSPTGHDNVKNVKTTISPTTYIKALYCLDDNLRRLRGVRARQLNCGPSQAWFIKHNPALFRASGYGHHPYAAKRPPDYKPRVRTWVTFGVLSRLTRLLDRIQTAYGRFRRFPVYITEFGYQTVPDVYGVPFKTQAKFLNWADYIAARNPRIRSVAQFLLRDGRDIEANYQTGLETYDGFRKPAYQAYQLPIWVTGSGATKRVWGMNRASARVADGGTAQVRVQFRPAGSNSFVDIQRVTTFAPGHQFAISVTPGPGALRLAYRGIRSRVVTVR